MESSEKPVFLLIEIIQTEEILKLELNELNLKRIFKTIYKKLLKENKINARDAYMSNPSGKAISSLDLNLNLKKIVDKFGTKLNLYNEKIM